MVAGESSTFRLLPASSPFLVLSFSPPYLDWRRKTINPGVQLRHGEPLTPDNGSVLVSFRLIAKLFLFARCQGSRPIIARQALLRRLLLLEPPISLDRASFARLSTRDRVHEEGLTCVGPVASIARRAN